MKEETENFKSGYHYCAHDYCFAIIVASYPGEMCDGDTCEEPDNDTWNAEKGETMQTIKGIEIDDFTVQYLATCLWSTTDEGETHLDANYGIFDFAKEAVAQAKKECERFQEENAELLLMDQDQDFKRNGHDFWLTRNGHGCGFWDGDYPIAGDDLTKACEAYGELWAYSGDDGLIYF